MLHKPTYRHARRWPTTLASLAAIMIILSLVQPLLAADGDLDTGFGTEGKVLTSIGAAAAAAEAVVIDGSGKIVVAGWSNNGSNDDFALVRYNSDGTIDSSFGTGGSDGDGIVTLDFGFGNDYAYAITIDGSGKIVVAGNSHNGSSRDFALVRYNSDGTLDSDFGAGGIVTTDFGPSDVARAVTIDGSGKIVVAGEANVDFAVLRYNSDGTLDNTFDSDGIVTTPIATGGGVGGTHDVAYGIAIDSSGKIVAAGTGGGQEFELARYNSDGSLDTTFDIDGKVSTDVSIGNSEYARAVAIDANGKIVVAGTSFSDAAWDDFTLVRYNRDGSLDTSFDGDGIATTSIGDGHDQGYAMAIDSSGKIVVAGTSHNGQNRDFALVRYTSDGSLDSDFGTGGKVTTDFGTESTIQDYGYAVTIEGSGKIVVAGQVGNDFALARYAGENPPLVPTPSIDTSLYYRLQNQIGEAQDLCLEGQGGAAPGSGAVLDGAAFMDSCQDVTGQKWKLVPADDGYYRLQNQIGEAQDLCLEGNRLAPESVLAGAAFMDSCQEVNGQLWKLVPDADGYYHLQTKFLEEQDKCLEGQGGAAPGSGAVLDGAAFMDDCQNVTGQHWKLVPMAQPDPIDTSLYYRLQTKFLEEQNKCFEGNRLAPESVLAGAAFMDDCQEVSGQIWKFVAVADGYYRLQTKFLESENRCLEGNRLAPESVLAGAAFMDICQEVTGQLWKLVPDADGYYRLQTKFLEEQDKCLEGNRLAPESVLAGAAFMDDCQEVNGQLWKLVPTDPIVPVDVNIYYRLQTQLVEAEGKCLEGQGGAAPGSGAVLDGSAFMDNCQNVTGQKWKLVAEADGYYRLQNRIGEVQDLCLEGNRLASESVLGGAAFMDSCQDVNGQLWKLVLNADGYYRLQTKFLEEQDKCLESQGGAAPGSGAVLDGAAFMDTCQEVSGQRWKLVPFTGTLPTVADSNGDGIPDDQQVNVETLTSSTGNYVTLVAPDGITLKNTQPAQPSVGPPQSVSLPQGVIGFDATGVNAGSSFSMTITIRTGQIANSYWKYGPTPDNTDAHWYEFLYDGTTGAVINGQTITLYFIDGARGDSDLEANGTIVDPGAPVIVASDTSIYLPLVQR